MPLQEHDFISADVFDVIRGIVLFLDNKGIVTRCNPYFESLTGYSSSEVIGKDWFDTFIPENDRESIRVFFTHVMKQGFNDGYTNSIITKHGNQLLIEWNSKTLDGLDGHIAGILCTGFDVTERTSVAMKLKKSEQNAVKATEAKTRFLAAASHDLRQPLQSLGLYLAVLSKQSGHSEKDPVIYNMRQSLNAMSELIDSLLNISKLDSGSVTADKCDVQLQELLERVVINNAQQAERKGLKLDCNKVDYIVHTDPKLLERLIENLVTNAIRYTEAGRVKIECLLNKDSVRVAISDTGIGISENHLKNVFEEYFQVDNQARDRRKGLGLGLSIVKHIGRILEHSIDVSSALGKGSTFVVEVALGQQFESVERGLLKEVSLSKNQPVVLFVDDNSAVLEATTMFLTIAGVNVYSALAGPEALAHITAGLRPDIIISDYRLPEYNGIEVIHRVRKATVNNLPAILMTGDTSILEIDNDNFNNCVVLQKPVDPDKLISLISELTE